MFKQIIKIDESKCDGCELCVSACHADAIGMVNGKAKLIHEDYCDGLGGCLPVCPTGAIAFEEEPCCRLSTHSAASITHLNQWPVQIKLVPVNALYFENANLLISADCSAYAYGNFHQAFMENRITLIGCPKLDDEDYSEKLTAIFKENNIRSVMIVRIEVPCCVGLENAVKTAIKNSGKLIPWQVETLSTEGQILEESLVF